MSEIETLRARCRELLEQQAVRTILGYRAGRRPDARPPAFITRPEDCTLLELDEHCRHNLAAWLPGLSRTDRVAVIATGPTARSIVNLLKESQLDRDRLHIIGVNRPGADDPALEAHPAGLSDEFIGQPAAETPAGPDPGLEAFESRSPEQRWEFISTELDRCIRCYACRQVCPNCYCPTCFVDVGRPQWVGRTPDRSDNILFHLMRAMHMAGRCVECGACARACPMGIDLMLINRKVSKIVLDRFGHRSGVGLDDELPLAGFSPEDRQEFIR